MFDGDHFFPMPKNQKSVSQKLIWQNKKNAKASKLLFDGENKPTANDSNLEKGVAVKI